MSMQTLIYPVKDLDAAKAIFAALLGVAPEMDEPYYVGWKIDGQDIGLDPHGHSKGLTGPQPYWHVEDIAKTVAALVEAGAALTDKPHDVGGGRLIATVKDADGNPIGVIQG